MTPPSMPRPSRTQLALALAIVRSKPASLSIRDYLSQLRAHLKPGKQPLCIPARHLDQAAYWQARCSQLESDLVRLQDENACLIHEKAAREKRPQRRRTAKRHFDGTVVAMAGNSNALSSDVAPIARNSSLLDLDQSAALCHHLFNLEKMASTSGSETVEITRFRAVQCAESLHGLARRCLTQKDSTPCFGDLLALSRAWTALVSASGVDAAGPEASTSLGSVAYHLISVFGMVLASLEAHVKDPRVTTDVQRVDAHAQALTKMLESTLQSGTLCEKLLEGIDYLVLRSVGKILSTAVFGHEPQPTRDTLQTSDASPPDNLPSDARILAPHLLALVRRCMSAEERHPPDRPHARLDAARRNKMHDTLLAGVFGDDNTIAAVFDMPAPVRMPTGSSEPFATPDLGKTDGFIDGLWSILGWDILASRIGTSTDCT